MCSFNFIATLRENLCSERQLGLMTQQQPSSSPVATVNERGAETATPHLQTQKGSCGQCFTANAANLLLSPAITLPSLMDGPRGGHTHCNLWDCWAQGRGRLAVVCSDTQTPLC